MTTRAAKGSILVIDDAADNRTLLEAMLDRAGYRVLLADSGAAGLSVLERDTPALIVLDYSMPGMSGPEVARQIRDRPATHDTPIVVLTASNDDGHIDEAFAAGANDYMTKPFDRRIFLARIESIIRAHGDRASAREHDRLRSDMEEASRVQQAQVASLPVCTATGTVMGAVVPCRELGGDLLQVFTHGDEATIVIIDVSGHGAAAALVASAVVTQLRAALVRVPLAEAFAELDRQLGSGRSEHYACIAAIRVTATGVTIVNAGLPPVSVLRAGKIVHSVVGCGAPPGLLAGSSYEPVSVVLEQGDRVVALSDGLTEGFGAADDVMPCLVKLGLLGAWGMRSSADIARDIRLLFAGAMLEDDATIAVIDRW